MFKNRGPLWGVRLLAVFMALGAVAAFAAPSALAGGMFGLQFFEPGRPLVVGQATEAEVAVMSDSAEIAQLHEVRITVSDGMRLVRVLPVNGNGTTSCSAQSEQLVVCSTNVSVANGTDLGFLVKLEPRHAFSEGDGQYLSLVADGLQLIHTPFTAVSDGLQIDATQKGGGAIILGVKSSVAVVVTNGGDQPVNVTLQVSVPDSVEIIGVGTATEAFGCNQVFADLWSCDIGGALAPGESRQMFADIIARQAAKSISIDFKAWPSSTAGPAVEASAQLAVLPPAEPKLKLSCPRNKTFRGRLPMAVSCTLANIGTAVAENITFSTKVGKGLSVVRIRAPRRTLVAGKSMAVTVTLKPSAKVTLPLKKRRLEVSAQAADTKKVSSTTLVTFLKKK